MTDDTSRRRDGLPDGDDLKGWREGLAEARGLAEERRVFAAMLELNGGGLDGYGWPILPVPCLPAISADGRVVAFTSFATNPVPHDTNKVGDIFVRTR